MSWQHLRPLIGSRLTCRVSLLPAYSLLKIVFGLGGAQANGPSYPTEQPRSRLHEDGNHTALGHLGQLLPSTESRP
jgi:hypothetical protein